MMFLALPVIAGPDAPVPPGWWPVPPGWWFLGLAVFLGLLWTGYLLLRRFLMAARVRRGRQLPVRTQAMAALDELAHRRSLDAREAAYRLNEILRAALFNVGADSSVHWPFPVWDGVIEDHLAWQHFWRELEMRYQPVIPAGNEDVERWLALAHGWIAHLSVDDVAHNGVRHKKTGHLLSLGRKSKTVPFPLP
ncbi:MAG: DUF4381 family protein [Mariprofundaceae bacterium]|nr:DUF4381 family protein [Mariprofundaceae bacterium]